MKRLPQYREPGRMDLVIHLALGIAAALAVINFFTAGVRLSSHADRVAQVLFTPPVGLAATTSVARLPALTNWGRAAVPLGPSTFTNQASGRVLAQPPS